MKQNILFLFVCGIVVFGWHDVCAMEGTFGRGTPVRRSPSIEKDLGLTRPGVLELTQHIVESGDALESQVVVSPAVGSSVPVGIPCPPHENRDPSRSSAIAIPCKKK